MKLRHIGWFFVGIFACYIAHGATVVLLVLIQPAIDSEWHFYTTYQDNLDWMHSGRFPFTLGRFLLPATLLPSVVLVWLVGRKRLGFLYGGLAYVVVEGVQLVRIFADRGSL